MDDFQGWLLKLGGQPFSVRYIKLETYKATPNQRTEIDAYRDGDNLLHRETSPNVKSKVEFETRELPLSAMKEIRSLLNGATTSGIERKMEVQYWNDEELSYDSMTCYAPDVEYTIVRVTKNNIFYAPIRFAFIEY